MFHIKPQGGKANPNLVLKRAVPLLTLYKIINNHPLFLRSLTPKGAKFEGFLFFFSADWPAPIKGKRAKSTELCPFGAGSDLLCHLYASIVLMQRVVSSKTSSNTPTVSREVKR
ncbi:MAG: hypothetical protein IJN34_05940, partial [Clostridia bacterium]|nr:hypothetical protein [Clostridia bacterium]